MSKTIDLQQTKRLLLTLLRPESQFYSVAILYGVAIGLLTLAVPIAVQTLINTIAHIASLRAVIVLAIVLFLTLAVSGVFSALRMRVMEHYERKVFARLTSELSLRTILAPHSFFEGRRNTTVTQRYFDIMTLQKNIPALMVDGFALMLQMLVGFTLVSFYHPALLVFNLTILAVMYVIWKVWSGRAKRSAIELSNAKYSTAKWLTDISAAHEFFKSSRHMAYAGKQSKHYVESYLCAHRHHFRYTFSQAVMFLLLYAVASASLLGLGGWLVIKGNLSIGQLVAAELIMSAVFLGLSRFSLYLKLYYELYGAAEKIGTALSIPQEESADSESLVPSFSQLTFKHVVLRHNQQSCELDLTMHSNEKWFVMTDRSWVQKQLIAFLKCYDTPASGIVVLGEQAISDYDSHALRQSVGLVDRSLIVECSIREYLSLASERVSIARMHEALEVVELLTAIEQLPDGLDTRLSVMGSPLQPLELLLLKLAVALISPPSILILNQHFDAIPEALRHRLLKKVADMPSLVLYFSNKPDRAVFNGTLVIEDTAMLQTAAPEVSA